MKMQKITDSDIFSNIIVTLSKNRRNRLRFQNALNPFLAMCDLKHFWKRCLSVSWLVIKKISENLRNASNKVPSRANCTYLVTYDTKNIEAFSLPVNINGKKNRCKIDTLLVTLKISNNR